MQGIDPKAEQKEAQAENSDAYTFETIDRAFFAILSFISSLISVRPTFASSKSAAC